MNNFTKFLLIATTICGLTACGNNDTILNDKIMLDSTYKIDNFIKINSLDYLRNLIENKDEFALYITSSTCLSCVETDPLLVNFIKNNNTVIYSLNVASNETRLEPINDIISYKATPTIVLYKDKEAKLKVDASTHPEIFKDTESITNFFKNNTFNTPLVKINEEKDIDEVIKSDCYFYFGYSKCGDCLYFENHYLKELFHHENMKTIYYFDLKEYFEDQSDEGKTKKSEFYKKYGISKIGNATFGYKNGCVPTYHKYEKGQLVDKCLSFNDGLERTYNDASELISVKVIDSYYKDAPFINHIYEKTDSLSAMENYRSSTLNFYIQKFNSFYKN